jgi:hypothetical protein
MFYKGKFPSIKTKICISLKVSSEFLLTCFVQAAIMTLQIVQNFLLHAEVQIRGTVFYTLTSNLSSARSRTVLQYHERCFLSFSLLSYGNTILLASMQLRFRVKFIRIAFRT